MTRDVEVARLADARVTDTHVVAVLADGREIATPLCWYPLLDKSSVAARGEFELSPFGIHWPDLDEDLSVEGMLAGRHAPGG